jgi:hydrogenase expression/formation protein HypE
MSSNGHTDSLLRAAAGGIVCPLPVEDGDVVQMAHGGGGRKTARLIDEIFVPAFSDGVARAPQVVDDNALGDAAVLRIAGGEQLAFTTDSFVVQPAFFPGGDIGSLAVHGTVNDLAVSGAAPIALSFALVLEEGFAMDDLRRIVASASEAARRVGVPIVTGDTKVVDRGKGDGVYVNTSGIGRRRPGCALGPRNVRPGDVILVSGPIGDHGIAVMAAREGLELHTALVSDSAPVWAEVAALLDAVPGVRTMRDPTRGGVATTLCELAAAAGLQFVIDEETLPVREEVAAACELLGLDPLYVACEGRFLAIVPSEEADRALYTLAALPGGRGARRIGRVEDGQAGRLLLRTRLGSHRRLERLAGEQLPRIC